LGKVWGFLGWLLWFPWAFLLYILGRMSCARIAYGSSDNIQPMIPVLVFLSVLLLIWWLCDVVDQQTERWKIVVGLVMLSLGVIPLLGIGLPLSASGTQIAIAVWLAYWMWERE